MPKKTTGDTAIDQYLRLKNMSLSDLADQIDGVSADRLSKIKRGVGKDITRDEAFAIEKATKHSVPAATCPYGYEASEQAAPAFQEEK